MQKDRLECSSSTTRSPSPKQEKVGGSEQDQIVEAGLFYNAPILAPLVRLKQKTMSLRGFCFLD